MLEGFEKFQFSSDAIDGRPAEFDVYTSGEGPVIIVIQELPGISQETLQLAKRLNKSGFRVVMPHLFGPLGKFSLAGNLVRVFCMRREFSLFAKNKSSPIVLWLKALCAHACEKYDVAGVGVIGMCLTGNFAISLMADKNVLASVAAQPSMPLFSQKSLHMSGDDVVDIKARLDEHGPMLSFRFSGDKICTAEKFDALDKAFNDDGERIRLRTIKGDQHAILTAHFSDAEGSPTVAALAEIVEYFNVKLAA